MPLTPPIYNNIIDYLGEANEPREILRRRGYAMEAMKRLGTPVLFKHMYNIDDVSAGTAKISPNMDTVYKQSSNADPLSYGVGYCSVQTQEGEWVSPTGELVIAASSPGAEYTPAPRYRGYGPGYLTYAILPDAPEDIFRRTPEGALLHTQQSTVQLPWWPHMGDNDLMIVVELDEGYNIIATHERYELKKVTPITMRGLDRRGHRNYSGIASGNRFLIGHSCEITKVPENHPIYEVETDR